MTKLFHRIAAWQMRKCEKYVLLLTDTYFSASTLLIGH